MRRIVLLLGSLLILLLAGWRGNNVVFRPDLENDPQLDTVTVLVADGPVANFHNNLGPYGL